MHEKNGAITDETPSEQVSTRSSCTTKTCGCKRPEKTANDSRTDHASTRAANAVADAARRQ